MKIFFICCLIFLLCILAFPQQSREEALQKIKSRQDLVVREVKKDLYKIEHIISGDAFLEDLSEQVTYTNTINTDSMVIEIFSIDTSLYSDMYLYWQSMDISNAINGLLIADFNSNGLAELYGNRTVYNSNSLSPGVFELNAVGTNLELIFDYPDTGSIPKAKYDIDNDGLTEILLKTWGIPFGAVFFKQPSLNSIPTLPNFIYPKANRIQVMSPCFGDFDKDGKVEFAFTGLGKTLYLAEFNPAITNFDSVFSFTISNYIGGITVGDFDLDGNTDIITGDVKGGAHIVEVQGNNQYVNVWNDTVEVPNAYYSFATNDIDNNGRPEFWIGGKHWTIGIILTCFEYVSNNIYVPKFKIKIPDYYSLNPLTTFTDDIDGNGEEEIIICADYFLLILKFSGSPNDHNYNIWYFNLRDFGEGETWTVTAFDLDKDGKKELFFDTYTQMDSMGQSYWKDITRIFEPNFTVNIKEQSESIIEESNLYSNFPNPFNPSTNVKFELNKSETVLIKVYNILGKEIKLLLNENLPAGEYTIQWDGKDNKGNSLPGGVYFIQMRTANYYKSIKTILLK